MTNLTIAAIVFLLLHLVVSGTRVRDALVQGVGARAYMGLSLSPRSPGSSG